MTGRVLVTGGTGAAGAATVKWLQRMGADVVVLARRTPTVPMAGVTYVAADIQDFDGVSRAVAGCDAVAHFAWTVSAMQSAETAEGIDIGGTTNLLRAMEQHDCRRMVFASSITVYGGHADHPLPFTEDETPRPAASFHYERNKVRAEKMILESGLEAVNVRPTVIVGRTAWSAPANIFRQPVVVTPGRDARMQLVHVDDVGRFCAQAALGGPTGTVNLVADDALTFSEMARIVGRPVINSGRRFSRMIAGAIGRSANYESVPDLVELFMHYPLGDTRKLTEEFGFRCAYSSADAVADMSDATSLWTVGNKSIRKPVRLSTPAVYPRGTTGADGSAVQILPTEYTGEFDNVTGDPELSEWSAANLSEAFPGPMTPFSLGMANRIMFSAANLLEHLFPMDADLASMVSSKQVGTIGHRLYNNMTVMKRLANAIPGQTPESFEHQMNGTPLPEGYRAPAMGVADVRAAAAAGLKGGPQIIGLGREVVEMERRAEQLGRARRDLPTISDEQLGARLEILMDSVVRAWDVNCMNTFVVSLPMNLISARYGEDAAMNVRAGTAKLRSAALLTGVRELADLLDRQPDLRRLIEDRPREKVIESLRTQAPDFAAKFDALLADCGHRGPGETELSNPVYADAPELLLRSVTGSLRSDRPGAGDAVAGSPLSRALTGIAVNAMERRERGRDVCMRITYDLRLALREWGTRLADRGVLGSPEDVHYLSTTEVFYPPADAKTLVERRRAERTRLAALDYPVHFSQPWTPEQAEEHAEDGVISGQAVSPGIARGRVRILSHPDDDFEPGEVLVANVTDTGWTPFFGCAAAIVTNVGGPMSHAAIVAREFGVPAVVNTKTATQRLKDGQLVEVDGTTGTIRVFNDAPATV